MLGVGKDSSKAQTVESLGNIQALQILCMRKQTAAMPKVRYQGGNDTKQRNISWQAKECWKPIDFGPTEWKPKLLTFLG